MKKLLIILVSLLLLSCVSMQQYVADTNTEFREIEPENSFVIEKDYEYVWNKLIEFITYLNIPLNTVSKENGLIIIDEEFKWSVGPVKSNSYYICQDLRQYHVFNGSELSKEKVDYGYVVARLSILIQSVEGKTKVTLSDTGKRHYLNYYVYQVGLVPRETNFSFVNSGKFKEELYMYLIKE